MSELDLFIHLDKAGERKITFIFDQIWLNFTEEKLFEILFEALNGHTN